MIVHFVIDEKIIDNIIDNFLQVSSNNIFLVFTEKTSEKFNHITNSGPYVKRYNYKKEDINEILDLIGSKSIILHQLNPIFAKTINQIKHSVKVAWIVWGFDVYSLPKIIPNLYAPITKQFLLKNKPATQINWFIKKNKVARELFYKLKGQRDPYSEVFKAIKRVDFFSTYIREDFDFFSKFYDSKTIRFVEASFSNIDQYLAGNKKNRISEDATNIIIGNSNTLESNYLDVISKISETGKEFKEIYCVLSYGNNKDFKSKVISEGQKQLKDIFHPLTDFMSREQYIELLRSCSVGIFFHYRQQAMGNIIALLYMGARVYLSEKNPAYHFFKRKGVLVNSFEKDFDIFHNKRLLIEDAENNRNKLDLIFNKEKVLNDLSQLSNLLEVKHVNS